ncbi:MAG: flagellar motor switch protein FliM [Candidatus Latescibacterota bacterium]|jgi:flagellar motor switch protein FliM
MADVMSKEETDALLAKPGEPPVGESPQPAGEQVVTPYDFLHPARVNRDQLRTLEGVHDNFARLLSSTLSGAMRRVVDVNTAFVDQTTYWEFIKSLSNPSCSYQFVMRPTRGQAVLDIAMPVVSALVDRIHGGTGSAEGVGLRQLTPIEIYTINHVYKRMIEDLETTWEPIVRIEIADNELETNPEFLRVTAANEIVILLAFEVNMPRASGLISLAYPYFTLESLLPRLSRPTLVRQSPVDREELILANRLRLGPMAVEMSAELGRTRISLAQARSLQAGDVVRLPVRVTDPVTVLLGDRPKFLARPFAGDDGGLKLKVTGRVPPDQQDPANRFTGPGG